MCARSVCREMISLSQVERETASPDSRLTKTVNQKSKWNSKSMRQTQINHSDRPFNEPRRGSKLNSDSDPEPEPTNK